MARETTDRTNKTRYKLLWQIPQTNKTDSQSQRTTDIEILEKILGLLRITEEYISDKNRTTELASSEEMSIVSIPAVYNEIAQIVVLKSMVSDLEWFNGDQMKFKDQQREI